MGFDGEYDIVFIIAPACLQYIYIYIYIPSVIYIYIYVCCKHAGACQLIVGIYVAGPLSHYLPCLYLVKNSMGR